MPRTTTRACARASGDHDDTTITTATATRVWARASGDHDDDNEGACLGRRRQRGAQSEDLPFDVGAGGEVGLELGEVGQAMRQCQKCFKSEADAGVKLQTCSGCKRAHYCVRSL